MDQQAANSVAQKLAQQFKVLPGVADVYTPQDLDYPSLQVNVNRERASQLGLTPKEVIDNVITSLTSNAMIAPSYWVDPKTGNNYFVTVQYPENQVKSLEDLKVMPLHAPDLKLPTYLNQVADVTPILTPTEVDHYQLQRTIDVYVAPSGEDLGRPDAAISKIVAATKLPPNIRINVRGLVTTMQSSFRSFGFGLFLSRPAGLPNPGRAVLFVHRSLSDRTGCSHRTDRRDAHFGFYRYDSEHSIADGHRDARWNGRVKQHLDRGFREPAARRGTADCARPSPIPAASACGRS